MKLVEFHRASDGVKIAIGMDTMISPSLSGSVVSIHHASAPILNKESSMSFQ